MVEDLHDLLGECCTFTVMMGRIMLMMKLWYIHHHHSYDNHNDDAV